MKTNGHGGAPSPKVAVGWLTDGVWRAAFGMSMVRLSMYEMARTGRPVLPMEMKFASGGLVEGRNQLVEQFLDATSCEWLLMVDVDMGFPADALERLLVAASAKERPVVGGLCFAVRRDGGVDGDTFAEGRVCLPTVYVWREFPDRAGFQVVEDYPRGELVLASATGAAFLLAHRSALVKVRDAENARAAAASALAGHDVVAERWFDRVQHVMHDDNGRVVFHTTFSEDMSFCIRLAGADVPVYVHTGVKTCHDKGGRFYDEAEWDAQLVRLGVKERVPS